MTLASTWTKRKAVRKTHVSSSPSEPVSLAAVVLGSSTAMVTGGWEDCPLGKGMEPPFAACLPVVAPHFPCQAGHHVDLGVRFRTLSTSYVVWGLGAESRDGLGHPPFYLSAPHTSVQFHSSVTLTSWYRHLSPSICTPDLSQLVPAWATPINQKG